ncbi:uncharacterized protein LOC131223850 isoform X2 [Magnolia sinica]|nr:uncharacterized protein LOC131223850 isoform X2 [Magnolia sinica]
MRDLDSVLRSSGGIRNHHSESPIVKEAAVHTHLNNKEETSQVTEALASMHSEKQKVTIASIALSHLQTAACLSTGHVDCSHRPLNLYTNVCLVRGSTCSATSAIVSNTSTKSPEDKISGKDLNLNTTTPLGLGLDLNAEDGHQIADHNPFYPYKSLGHVKPAEPSECGSSIGPLKETESLRRWKAMKQNGFLSSLHGGIPMPKQRGPSRKNKTNALKKKMDLARKEQVDRFTKIAAPSGLLAGLNPGIINHVRNSKQVHSIIEALVRSEKLDNEAQNRSSMPWNRPYIHSCSEHKCDDVESDVGERKVQCEPFVASHFAPECEDDRLTLKLPSAITMASENTSSVSNEDFSMNQDSITSLSLKAATVASQWLELLHQDIRGRLIALQRSKKRVRAVIQTEIPSLMSREFSLNQENESNFGQFSGAECCNNAPLDVHHVERWWSLFNQMDKALSEEANHLETWLRQVKEMQSHCEQGLQYVNSTGKDGLQHLGLSGKDSRSKKAEMLERECAVRAAAASIYSTCNLVMTAENVSCF